MVENFANILSFVALIATLLACLAMVLAISWHLKLNHLT